ncbi:tetraspanin-2A [Neodiprion virginianus]|uniref:tetraspanin-2A n=1 Tax=Neodiprion fabricii TaxID=2872261 RepID=UPI001ED91EEF|nr:tetraspanin-2A [Neodiprion fabricii]XP_046625353.1 tetraspanin-2A [Neodiprion virginianus]
MAGTGRGTGAAQLEQKIGCIKYLIFCFNAVSWIFGASLFGLSLWMRLEPGFEEWVGFLGMWQFYIGIYILIAASVIVMIISFVGCGAALMELVVGLYAYIGLQILSFVCGLAGAAVLLDYSTYDSSIQPIISTAMTNLISNSQYEGAAVILRMVQENIGCCGANGPMDYLTMLKPLPTECRDTVTGNAFFHGCVDELTWFLEARSGWIAGLALSLCMLHVVLAVLALILIQAIKKEEEIAYKQ